MTSPNPAEVLRPVDNGAFLRSLDPQAAYGSALGQAVAFACEEWFRDNQGLSYTLELMKSQQIWVISDYWDNTALPPFEGLDPYEPVVGINDGASNRLPIAARGYLRILHPSSPDNPLNRDPRFPNMRPLGFEIADGQQPVMALVALDPSQLERFHLSDGERSSLIDGLRPIFYGDDAERDATLQAMQDNERLYDILSACLLANDTYTQVHDEHGQPLPWRIDFGRIACAKAAYLLLSGDDASGNMRQGAVRVRTADGRQVIAAGSGLNSATDEAVARSFGNDIVAALESGARTTRPGANFDPSKTYRDLARDPRNASALAVLAMSSEEFLRLGD